MTAVDPALPELLTADDERVRACTADGVDHDYRPFTKVETASVSFIPAVKDPNAPTRAEVEAGTQVGEFERSRRTYLRCVWCHAVTCGDADETDPCIEPYHHRVPHRTRMGVVWPIGGDRPNPKGARP